VAIYLVRHGLSEGNLGKYFQGHLDPPLTDQGRQQAAALGQWLGKRDLTISAMYTSPLKRARQTAEIIGASLGPTAIIDEPDLIEYHGGQLEGLTLDEATKLFPDYLDRPLAKRGDFSAYGGESYQQMQQRLERFISRVQSAHPPDADIIVVAHGGSLYQLLKRWCGWPTPRHFFVRFSNCVCLKLERREIVGQTVHELCWMIPLELTNQELSSTAREYQYPPAD